MTDLSVDFVLSYSISTTLMNQFYVYIRKAWYKYKQILLLKTHSVSEYHLLTKLQIRIVIVHQLPIDTNTISITQITINSLLTPHNYKHP